MFKNVLMVLGIAAATMAATLPLCWPSRVGAVGPAGSPAAGPPTLAFNGLSVSARSSADTYKVGEQPVVTLEAVNTTNQEASATLHVSFTSLSPGSELSRRALPPMDVRFTSQSQGPELSRVPLSSTELVKLDVPLTLAAGEKTTVPLKIDLKLTKAAAVTMILSAGDKQIAAARFTVKADAPSGGAVTKDPLQNSAQAPR